MGWTRTDRETCVKCRTKKWGGPRPTPWFLATGSVRCAGRCRTVVRLRRLETALLEQRLDARIAPAERAIELRHVLGAAAREHHLAEALAVRARHAAVLLEPRVRVVVEHFAPEVRVVAGRIAAAP